MKAEIMETSADRKAEPHPSKQYLIYEGVMSALHVFHMSCLTCTLNPSTAICLRAASRLDTRHQKEIITSHCRTECAQYFFSLQPCLTSPSVQPSVWCGSGWCWRGEKSPETSCGDRVHSFKETLQMWGKKWKQISATAGFLFPSTCSCSLLSLLRVRVCVWPWSFSLSLNVQIAIDGME